MELCIKKLIYSRIHFLENREKELNKSVIHAKIDINRNKNTLMEAELYQDLSKIYYSLSEIKSELFKLTESVR